MSNTKNKPGIHLYRDGITFSKSGVATNQFYWHTRAKNGKITSNGETYKTKQGALDGISSAAKTLGGTGRFKYYDHSKPNTPLITYL
jgi:uncharacterized protein YegP (UPF0339 family)